MDGRTDGCRWLNLLVMGATVCAASNNALMHSFSLVLLPGAQLVWLALVGVWGTLQHRWLTEEAPSFALFLSEILHGLTPLLSPPLLTWGALAAQIVAVNQTAFCLAALCPLHTIYFATPSKGIERLGRSEAQVLAATGVLLPALVHVSIHYQLLGLPSYGSGGLVLSALSAAVFRSGGESLSSDDLDDAQTDVLWELAILLTGGFLAVVCIDAKIAARDSDGDGLGLSRCFGLSAAAASSSSSSRMGRSMNSDGKDGGYGKGERAFLGKSPRLAAAACGAAALLLFAVERRFLLPTFRGHLAVAPPRDAYYLTLALWSALAGAFARAVRLAGDEPSALALQGGAGVAALVVAHLTGLPLLLRPMGVAAALALCEFVLSKELVWYLVAVCALGGAMYWWCHKTVGFLEEGGGSSYSALPRLGWLPWLGASGSQGAPLQRLIVWLVALALLALVVPAMVWSGQSRSLTAAALCCHAGGLLLVEALLSQLPSDAYPTHLLLLSGLGHVASAWHLRRIRGASPFALWFCLCLAASKVVGFTGAFGGVNDRIQPSAVLPLLALLLASTAPLLHPPRSLILARSSNHRSADAVKSGGGGDDEYLDATKPLSAQDAGIMSVAVAVAVRWAAKPVLRPLLSGILHYTGGGGTAAAAAAWSWGASRCASGRSRPCSFWRGTFATGSGCSAGSWWCSSWPCSSECCSQASRVRLARRARARWPRRSVRRGRRGESRADRRCRRGRGRPSLEACPTRLVAVAAAAAAAAAAGAATTLTTTKFRRSSSAAAVTSVRHGLSWRAWRWC